MLSTIHTIEIDSGVFSDTVIQKTLYWLAAKYSMDIRREGALTKVHFQSQETDTDWLEVESQVRRGLLDYAVRQAVDEETRTIRELIIAKAFHPPLPK